MQPEERAAAITCYDCTGCIGGCYLASRCAIDCTAGRLGRVNRLRFFWAWSKTSGHNAPLAADPNDPAQGSAVNNVSAAVARFLAAGAPRSELLLGLPLFGRTWKSCDRRQDGEYQMCDGPGQGTWEES